MNASTPASNHASYAKGIIARRNVTFKKVPLTSFVFDREWERLRTLCGSETSANEAWKEFEGVISESYSTEREFGQILFNALEKALGSACCRTLQSTDTQKIMQITDKKWGFSTQAVVERKAEKDLTRFMLGSNISLGASDHACVLFDESGEIAKDVMAIVELNMSDSSCGPIQPAVTIGEETAISWDIFTDHGPIAPTVVYILDRVIPDHVRNNVQPTVIPIMVLTANKKDKESQNKEDMEDENKEDKEDVKGKKEEKKRKNKKDIEDKNMEDVRGKKRQISERKVSFI